MVLPSILWLFVYCIGTFWQNYLAPGTIPEYQGVSLRINQEFVDRIWFGYRDSCPKDYFILIQNAPKRLIDLQIEDAKLLGMKLNPEPSFGDTAFELGIVPHQSYMEFKNGRLLTFQARHRDFKFSKTADGPFFSLPISFDEYKKIFGKPLRWRREFSGRRVP
jgi:hypothetical protein